MHVNRGDGRIDRQVGDTGLLRRFAQGGRDDVGIAGLAMSSELKPAADTAGAA